MNEEQYVVFHLGKEEYCVPIHQVREIIQYKGATQMPGAPAYFEGIINLRGRIIPVIDLAAKFEVPRKDGERQALIVDLGEKNFGIVVDQVSEVMRLQDSAIETAPSETRSGCILGIAKATGDRLLILLELANLVIREDFNPIIAVS